jgi:hypothetical protein
MEETAAGVKLEESILLQNAEPGGFLLVAVVPTER